MALVVVQLQADLLASFLAMNTIEEGEMNTKPGKWRIR
jgi:hypothetical protein